MEHALVVHVLHGITELREPRRHIVRREGASILLELDRVLERATRRVPASK